MMIVQTKEKMKAMINFVKDEFGNVMINGDFTKPFLNWVTKSITILEPNKFVTKGFETSTEPVYDWVENLSDFFKK